MLKFMGSTMLIAAAVAAMPAFAAVDRFAKMDETPLPTASITLNFTVAVAASRSTATVTGPNGGEVAAGWLLQAAKTQIEIPLKANLLPGTYTINFAVRAVSGALLTGETSVSVGAPLAANPRLEDNRVDAR